MSTYDPSIQVALRFHVSFYHSYRGDTNDEDGFGKDIRIIRNILDDLGDLERSGIVVHCAWDFDNAFSLGNLIPRYAMDIIECIKDRIDRTVDEIHVMSWNNGLTGVHTAEELKLAIGWAISAPDKSGIDDVFGSHAPIVRPQECMFNATQIPIYRSLGIEAVSLYYSAIPFNAFGSFIPLLPVDQRYNPICLQDPISKETIRLLPAVNHGDLAENWLSIRRMVKRIRGLQMAQSEPVDTLLLIDLDADDSFWTGMVSGPLKALFPMFGGLQAMIISIVDIPYIRFTKATEYMASHPDRAFLSIGQDMADGSFDGYASWAEKYEDHELWTHVSAIRRKWNQAKELVAKSKGLTAADCEDFFLWSSRLDKPLYEKAQQAMVDRLRLLSTTHFGLSAPVMHVHRYQVARDLAEKTDQHTTTLLTDVQKSCQYVAEPVATRTYDSLSSFGKEQEAVLLPNQIKLHDPWVQYGRKIVHSNLGSDDSGIIALGDDTIQWHRHLKDFEGSPVIDMDIVFPATHHRGCKRRKAMRLGRTWDKRWIQIAPMEIAAFEDLDSKTVVTVWKEDFAGTISSYQLDYWHLCNKQGLSSINNHVTPSWVTVSAAGKGLLVAQGGYGLQNMAFCPIRQIINRTQQIYLNPFGTYWGPQYRYPLAISGIGRLAAMMTAEHIHPSAPSWEGKHCHFSIMLASYEGCCPPHQLQEKGHAFTHGIEGER